MNPRTIGCPEAEFALLGCLLRLPAARVIDIARRMDGEDLVDPRHRAILAAAVTVAACGTDPDPILVLGHLRAIGLETSFTDDRPAAVYLSDVFTGAGVPANVEAYLRVVLEHAYRRRIVEAAERLLQVAGLASLPDLRELFEEQVTAVRQACARSGAATAPAVRAVA